jgi:protein transport protein SEC31
MADGSVALWNVNEILTNYKRTHTVLDNNTGCVCLEQGLYETPVYAIDFNYTKKNLIALGGGSDVLIMNIESNISKPDIFSPGEPNLHEGSVITSISWNKKVPHILASASMNGLAVVWDLKSNKSIFNFQDSLITYNTNVTVNWNPEMPTQLAVGYNDPKKSEVQIWDLRNPQGPVMVLEGGHTLGK